MKSDGDEQVWSLPTAISRQQSCLLSVAMESVIFLSIDRLPWVVLYFQQQHACMYVEDMQPTTKTNDGQPALL